MNQQEVEAWIAANGGAGAVQYGRATTQVDNPAADPITAKAAGVKFDPTAPDKITISTEKWTNPKTGAVLHVKRNADGQTFDIVDQANADPSKSQLTPAQQQEEILNQQRAKNAALPGPNPNGATEAERRGQDPRYETDEDRAKRADATIKQQGADARQAQIDEQNAANVAADNKRADEAAARTAAAANAPVVQIVDDGKGGKVAIIVDKATGGVKTVQTDIKGTPPTLTVSGTVYQLQPDGKSYAPAAGIPNPNAPIPAGAPKYVPDYNAPDLGLTAYNEALIQWTQSGGGTREQGKQLLETAAGLATQTASHGTTLASQASTTRSQDITQRGQTLGEVQSRRSASDTGFDNAQSTYIGNAAHLGAGKGGLAADAFREALMLRQGYAQQAGGYADVPAVPLSPAMQAMRTTTVHPDGKVVHSTPVFEPRADPNGAPVAAPGAAASGAGAPSAQSVSAPTVSTTSATPAPDMRNSSDMDLPPGTPPAGVGSRVNDEQPGAARFAPDFGAPAVPYNDDPSQGPVGQVPGYLQPARSQAPVFDPSPVVAELRQRGFSDAAINQALDEHQQEMGAVA